MGPNKISASAIWAAVYAHEFWRNWDDGYAATDGTVKNAVDVANAAVRELSARAAFHGVELVQ